MKCGLFLSATLFLKQKGYPGNLAYFCGEKRVEEVRGGAAQVGWGTS